MDKKIKAIDLYAGVGGWAVGLQMSGIEIVESYEWWDSAILTHGINSSSNVTKVDIRKLALEELPKDIDVVVGSPPCTEFSYSNRGGSGDISNGLKDIEKFLEVVDYLRPKFWVMENVPRVKKVLDEELKKGGSLYRFRHLGLKAQVIDMSEFGLPQKRKRCIAGNIDFDLLLSYRKERSPVTLGEVVAALSLNDVVDPIYGVAVPKRLFSDHEIERALSDEELRYNREWKCHHPVYNDMSFPEKLDDSVRTITATCTRVSRESIIIKNGKGKYRRLSVRERGCLQGFPATFQFHGKSYAQKIKMVGNAVPPLFTFYVAQTMQGVSAEGLTSPSEGISRIAPPSKVAPATKLDREGRKYPKSRRFWFAIPNLRFKSGWRFDLSNKYQDETSVDWAVRFWHGNSKNILELPLTDVLVDKVLCSKVFEAVKPELERLLDQVVATKKSFDPVALHEVWTHRSVGHHPYELLDRLGSLAKGAASIISSLPSDPQHRLVSALLDTQTKPHAKNKASRFATEILAGVLIGGRFNSTPFQL